jgi:hypothetical protein
MQQMYSCPNCRAPVAFGQAACANCKMVFNWPPSPTQPQNQSPQSQYPGQQDSLDNQSAVPGDQDLDHPQDIDDGPGLLQRIQVYKETIIKISISVVIVTAFAGAAIAMWGEISRPFVAPVVSSFDASASTITPGQEATLHWDVAGASSVSISPGIGTVSSNGSRTVSPESTATYTLIANNISGSVRKSVTIKVTAAPPSIDKFGFNTDSIFTGQSAILSWSVTGATSVSINPDIGTVSSAGTQSVSPSLTTTYTLTASNSAGNPTALATLTVTKSSAPIITTFSASEAFISGGQSSTLAWDIIGPATIYINQGVGAVPPKGSKEVTPTATTIYTLTAENANSKVSRSVTVTVEATNAPGPAITKDPPAIKTFFASSNSITLGDNITLTWAVSGARAVSISPDVGAVPASGWTMVIPTATDSTYKLSAVNTFGTETAEVTVTVNKSSDGTAPVIKSFTAVPGSITVGGTSSLSWSIKGAALFTIDQGIGIPASKFSQLVSPSVTTDYTLTAINSAGTDRAIVTVTVVQ